VGATIGAGRMSKAVGQQPGRDHEANQQGQPGNMIFMNWRLGAECGWLLFFYGPWVWRDRFLAIFQVFENIVADQNVQRTQHLIVLKGVHPGPGGCVWF
jgi:hypothetical protein